jgi:hypothetical protein
MNVPKKLKERVLIFRDESRFDRPSIGLVIRPPGPY